MVGEFPRFGVSNYGSLIGVDFFGDGFLSYYPGDPFTDIFGSDLSGINLGADGLIFDFDNNGIEDCLQTANGTLNQRFAGFAGCHIVDTPGGPARPFVDGLIADEINQFGGDGTNTGLDGLTLIPKERRFTFNTTAKYDLTPNMSFFFEGKYSRTKATTSGPGVNSFYDSIPIRIDNPYIPDNLRTTIETFVNDNPAFFDLDDVLLFVGRDLTDFGPNIDEVKRETIRLVGGFEGEFGDVYRYELAVNYGRTTADTFDGNAIIMDRLYAAIDAVDDGTGNIVCRSDLVTRPL
ncbi:hypothetical protein [Amphiplicatus metriothermophilus]|uniref:Uncharacterized protein n=1 Tax=Amphiplicatus metriothermophilus TaxID=1519374 RepID=A0A239PX70_9PROT|nr:hypothetical protein [Amphiplicatus metriothermophilus]MBB5520020.1 hypothetical protein [Amphiplicatus metriothermophilus]SNT74919.1 hypothetical protein SAMN06297382_2510 [Amphiplicatus metriothermophilus]